MVRIFEELPSGQNSIHKDVPKLAAGIYMIRIQTADGIVTQKLVLTGG